MNAISGERLELPFSGNTWSNEPYKISQVLANMKAELAFTMRKQVKAKSRSYAGDLLNVVVRMRRLCDIFNRPMIELPESYEKVVAYAEIKDAENAAKRAAKNAAQIAKEAELLDKWLAGEYHGQLYNLPIYLRLKGESRLQTSHGAEVHIMAAHQAYKALCNGVLRVGDSIGGFKINAITDAYIVIGCHRFNRSLVDEFFAKIQQAETV
jgi:hypothetical protein